MAWFSYIGGVPSAPSSYTLTSATPSCAGTTSLCAIYAVANATGKPVITTTLLAAISQAVSGAPSRNAIDKD